MFADGQIRIGAFTLDASRGALLGPDDDERPLRRKSFALLGYLAANAGRLIGRAELMEAVWPDVFVTDDSLTQLVREVRRALDDQAGAMLRTVPGRGYLLAGVSQAGPTPVAAMLPRSPTSFVGRLSERTALQAQLRSHRLVTITGIGGIGKTRLALQAAAEAAGGFADGIRLVDLAPVTDPSWLTHTLASAVDAGMGEGPAEAALIAALRGRAVLLIIDNAEHLTAPLARLLRPVLGQCPAVTVLVTSRESLGVPGESILHLQPLAAPTERLTGAAAALAYDAVRLFVERAAVLIPGFRLDDANATPVAEICSRLDGIALAIEMVVPRLKVLTPQQVVARLHDRFRLLPPLDASSLPRQRTLRGMFDWSWELLSGHEQRLLEHLAAFAGSASLAALVTLNAAEGASEWDVIDRLASLVDKSLVVPDRQGPEPRYRLLETTRIYVLERLAPAAVRALRHAHATYMAEVFEQAEVEWPTTQDALWVDRYGPDADNLRSALDWAFAPAGDEALGLRLVAPTYPLWWDLPGLPLRESRHWFDLAIARLRPDTPTWTAARIWLGRSWRDARFGDLENFPAASRSVALFRLIDDPIGLGAALWRAGNTMLTHETADTASMLLDEAACVLRTQPPSKFLALCLVKQADLLLRQGWLDAAYDLYAEALRVIRSIGTWYGLMTCTSNMADAMLLRGEREEALAHLQASRAELPRELRSPHGATFAAHLALAGKTDAAYEAAREVATFAPAIGLTGALGWIAETLALLRMEAGDSRSAARLAGFARHVHPSTATRAGARQIVFQRLDAGLGAAMAANERLRLEGQGAAWSEIQAADLIAAAARDHPQDQSSPQHG